MKLFKLNILSVFLIFIGMTVTIFAQIEDEAPIADIGEFQLTTQALGRFSTVPHEGVPDETPNYYAQFSLWVGAVDQNGIFHVTSAEEGIEPEWRPIPQTWEESLDIVLPAVKTVNQGAFTDVCNADNHTPLGLNVTMTCYGFDQKGFALYDFAIERASGYMYNLTDIYIGIQVDIDVPSSPADVNGADDRIMALCNNRALAVYDSEADLKKDPLLGVALPGVGNPKLSWWTSNSDPATDEERYTYLSGSVCQLPVPENEDDYRFLISDGPYNLGSGDVIHFTAAIINSRGEKKFETEAEQAEQVYSQHLTPLFQQPVYKPLSNKTNLTAESMTFQLMPAYPNPFNSSTRIAFTLPKEQHVNAVIYNLLGQPVRNCVNGIKQPGKHEIIWDGKNNQGNSVVSGVYLLTLKTETEVRQQKLIIMK